jgi:hypothetical protein
MFLPSNLFSILSSPVGAYIKILIAICKVKADGYFILIIEKYMGGSFTFSSK